MPQPILSRSSRAFASSRLARTGPAAALQNLALRTASRSRTGRAPSLDARGATAMHGRRERRAPENEGVRANTADQCRAEPPERNRPRRVLSQRSASPPLEPRREGRSKQLGPLSIQSVEAEAQKSGASRSARSSDPVRAVLRNTGCSDGPRRQAVIARDSRATRSDARGDPWRRGRTSAVPLDVVDRAHGSAAEAAPTRRSSAAAPRSSWRRGHLRPGPATEPATEPSNLRLIGRGHRSARTVSLPMRRPTASAHRQLRSPSDLPRSVLTRVGEPTTSSDKAGARTPVIDLGRGRCG